MTVRPRQMEVDTEGATAMVKKYGRTVIITTAAPKPVMDWTKPPSAALSTTARYTMIAFLSLFSMKNDRQHNG